MNEKQEPKRVSTAIAKYTLSELVENAQHRGEITIIQRYNRDSAIIAPLSALPDIRKDSN